jgi:hypothetical protein
MAEIKGGCRCGAVTFHASVDPVFVGLCHCRNCQKETGSAFSSVIGLPAPALTVSGTTKTFDSVGDSGQGTHRSFCPECGSTVTHWADIMQGVIMVNVGSLDDPTWAKPAMQIYCGSALSWAVLPDLQAFPKMPV